MIAIEEQAMNVKRLLFPRLLARAKFQTQAALAKNQARRKIRVLAIRKRTRRPTKSSWFEHHSRLVLSGLKMAMC
jgi:hypothetical protein